jgi:hypothetical protein
MDPRLFPLLFTIACFYVEEEEELASIHPHDRSILRTVSARKNLR